MPKRPKRATIDALFSQVIRERDNYTCRICFGNFRHDPGRLDCAHSIGRSRGSVRWDMDNAFALCRRCHNDIDQRPLDHIEFVRKELGEERYEALKVKARELLKMTDRDRIELAAHFRETLKAYRVRRANGEIGRLE
ncbi:MAG: hypothetical protein O2783_08185 [Chloroflexi bacterium]|nr:hypothetical protein [Chloroflexota bacterium]